jgi:aryl-alcohol dehydrogenase-like predicted oxidoreductase
MKQRELGKQGLKVSELGLGCMGMSWAYGPADEAESIRTLHRSLELGINFWDTAQIYGPFTNEQLLGKALRGKRRDQVVIATKFAWKFGPNNEQLHLDSSPQNIKETVEASLKRLGIETIDLLYQHRLDPNTRIEETVSAMADLISQGKVRYLGLSEVGPGTIRRAHAVHPISAVQSEYSLWERGVEPKVLPQLRKLGIGLVAYSPLGRGFLTGAIPSPSVLHESDWRRNNPRFEEGNLKKNLEIVEKVRKIAQDFKVTPGQIALAWLLKQGADIVPIPGTKHVNYLEENTRAAGVSLPASAWSELDTFLQSFKVVGTRYPEAMMKFLDTTE